MSAAPLDAASVHRYFAAECFNGCWALIEKEGRTAADDEQMLLLAMASLWHWSQRADCTRRHRSIGYWQVSRVYALLGQAENARRYGELCLQSSAGEPPFFAAYAHEALARAAHVAGDRIALARHAAEARRLAAEVVEAEDRALLEKDLETLGPPPAEN